jgi:hypothetical protein
MLSQYSFGEGGVLMHAPTLPHYYIKGEPACDAKGKPLSATEAAEQRMMESIWVLPKALQQDICYLHHYSRGAAHPQWYDLVTQINEAGYTWRGMKTSCSQMCSRCRVCYRATRTKTYNAGLFTSHRFRRPFEAVSWDFPELGHGLRAGQMWATYPAVHTGFCELYMLRTLVMLRQSSWQTAYSTVESALGHPRDCLGRSGYSDERRSREAGVRPLGHSLHELHGVQQERH